MSDTLEQEAVKCSWKELAEASSDNIKRLSARLIRCYFECDGYNSNCDYYHNQLMQGVKEDDKI